MTQAVKTDNIQAVRDIAKRFCLTVEVERNTSFPFLCCHPFTDYADTIIMDKENNTPIPLDLTKNKDYNLWTKQLFAYIDKSDIIAIVFRISSSWRLTFLKLIKESITAKTFAQLLGEVWVLSESPNNDVNCPVKLLLKWFKECDKEALMRSDDNYNAWLSLPDEITVYRGIGKKTNPNGISWTTNKEKAIWFANRFDNNKGNGYLLTAKVKKEHILACFNGRAENEVIVDVNSINLENKICKEQV